jgi:hypothetical protein
MSYSSKKKRKRGGAMELGVFYRDLLIERLAKKFYAVQGYHVSDNYKMQTATHPQEVACVKMAIIAIEEFEIILKDCKEEEEEEED